MTMAKLKDEQIFIGIGDERIELIGADKEAFLEQRIKDQAELALLEALALEKQQKRVDAITKLGEASGLTTDEINAILNI
jgi:hypothetical protein